MSRMIHDTMTRALHELNHRLSRLRELLHGEPDAALWAAICDLIGGWPEGDELLLALEYAEQHLCGWPDALRAAPRAWWSRALRRGDATEEPRLRLARALRVSLSPGERRAWALARRPELRFLRHLQIVGQGAGDAEVRALLEAPHLRALRALCLRATRLSADGVALLASSARLETVERLDLGGNRFGSAELEALATARHLTTLQHLDLSSNALAGADLRGLTVLGRSTRLSGLQVLRLDWNHLHPRAVEVFAPMEGLGELRELDLSHNPIGDQGAEALARSPATSRLRVLRLASAGIGDRGAEALARSPHVSHLRRLDLLNNPIGDPGAQALASSPHLGGLARLELSRHHLTRRGLMALATSTHLNPRLVASLTHPAAFLRVLGHHREAVFHPIYEGVNTLGGGAVVDVALDRDGERHDCTVSYDGRGFAVLDLDTPGGLRVNGHAVTRAEVGHGDRIEVGRHVLELRVVPSCHIRRL